MAVWKKSVRKVAFNPPTAVYRTTALISVLYMARNARGGYLRLVSKWPQLQCACPRYPRSIATQSRSYWSSQGCFAIDSRRRILGVPLDHIAYG